MKSKIYLTLIILFFLFIGCKQKPEKYSDTTTTGRTTICSDETFQPIIENEINVFHSIYKYSSIKSLYKPEIEAFNLFIKDSVNLIIATRPLNQKEKEYFEQIKIYPRTTKIAIDAIAFIVNTENNDTLISVEKIKEILSGKITKWSQINPKSKLGDIKIVFDNKNSSTVRYVIDSIVKGSKLSSSCSVLNTNNNNDVIDFVQKNKSSMGIIGVSWISNSKDSTSLSFYHKIKVMWISKEKIPTIENSYQPFQAYIAQHLYPFTRNVYVISRDVHSGLSTGFSGFIASDKGQRIILKAGILPATQPVRIVNVKQDY
jgi:phosphate transport system substrate-binding protein